MNTEYLKYKVEDFLMDDFFVDTMLEPTDESKAFWKSLTDEHKVDVNEFISAYMTLKSLNEAVPKVPEGRAEELLKRIEHTNKVTLQRKKRLSILRYSSIAASILLVLGISLFSYLSNGNGYENQSLVEFANANSNHLPQKSKYIELISNNESLMLVGTHADVKYDESGNVKVNKETIKAANAKKATTGFNQLRVPYGKRAFLALSDGTELWVNVGTVVSYPTVFAKDIREIYVDGEVYANVTHDPNRPFIIRTSKLDVRVLGTSFNVSAYQNDKQINVVLVNGSVHIQPISGKETVMKPNQMYSYTDQSVSLKRVDVEKYISWRNGNYSFQNESIENILLLLSRYYNVTMKFPDTASGISFSGKLEIKDDISQILNGLEQITDMSYMVKDSIYIFDFNK